MDENPFLKRRTQHKIGKPGRKSESRVAKELGAKLRPASGAMAGAKGDMAIGAILLEAKSTIHASMTIKHDWLAKIAREARSEGKTPALAVSFINEGGKDAMDGEWVMIPAYKFRDMLG